tara:strand:+ start:1091 stop:1333 length:243 start_codon:yes stop_codon:yes gene_type:complete
MVVDVVAITSVVIAGIVSVVAQIQHSKCNWIKCGCLECTRILTNTEEETNNTLTRPNEEQEEQRQSVYIASPVISGRTSI